MEKSALDGYAVPNGKVLVVGGYNGSYLASVELYDPVTVRRQVAPAALHGALLHTATLLPNGDVLVAGGDNDSVALASAELYDPVAGTWTATGAMLEATAR